MDPLAALLGVPLVPYKEWFARLKATAEFASEASLSALKLLDFFQHGLKPAANKESMGLLPKVASQKGVRTSQTLVNGHVQSLGTAEAELWIWYWREIGFIPVGAA
jgi:hypothetical protein